MSRCPDSDAARPQAHAPTSPIVVSHKSPRPNPVNLYRPPWAGECHRMWRGVNEMRAEVAAMDPAALAWDLRRVRRARAAFKPAELRDGFPGSKRNPVMSQESSYLFLFSDYLRERAWAIRSEMRRREEEATP